MARVPQIVALSASPARVAVVGSTNIDLIAYTPRIPGAGETIIGDRFSMGFGGKGANQAVMARLLGAEVAMVNCLGDDPYGDMTLDNFADLGIDTTHVHRVDGASGVAPIWVEPDGTNRIIVVPGANHRLTPAQAVDAVTSMPDLGVVLGQFEIPQEVTTAAFAQARRLGVATILNPAPGDAVDSELLAATDWIIPNQVELAAITGASATDDAGLTEAASDLGCRLVVTLGEEGALLVTAEGSVRRFEAPTVTAVDTTGAGDAFVGAFAYGLACAWPEDAAIRLGILCAAESVTREGTQTSFPRDGDAAALLEAARSSG
jgi:ribokinase